MPASPRTACEDVRCDLFYGHPGQHVASRDSSRQALREALDGAIGSVKVSGHIEALPASHYAGHVEVRLHERGFAIEAEAAQQQSAPAGTDSQAVPLDVRFAHWLKFGDTGLCGELVDCDCHEQAAEYARLAPAQARPADAALREAIEEARETWYERHNRPEWVQRHGYAMDKLGRAALAQQPTPAEDE